MAAISLSSSSTNPKKATNYGVYSPCARPFRLALRSSLFGSTFPGTLSAEKPRVSGPRPLSSTRLNAVSASHHSFDVVVVGAGIIGLSIARQLLLESDLSVAVIDRAVPCSGATGAGQGYIWMSHKTPGSDIWELAVRSQKLWETLANSIEDQGLDPLDVLGWMRTGSLVVGGTREDTVKLKERVKQLSEAGVRAEFLSSRELRQVEPALLVQEERGAALVPGDSQLDAQRTVAFIEKGNRKFQSQGRYAEFYHDPVVSLLRTGDKGEVKAVQTSKNTLYSKKAVVVATGCWSGSLMHNLFPESDISVDIPVKPRKGHLLVLENFDSVQVNHGLMEFGYMNHQSLLSGPTSAVTDEQKLSVSMTAIMDATGNLVLGSSRQFVGFNTEVDETIIDCIWKRAGEFFPKLREISLSEIRECRKVRVGLRPYMPDGRPVIGQVPCSNVFVAAGHEGSGLSLALGTAEMVADMVLGNPLKVDSAPFAVKGRSC
ncbi:uncharacterized protein LOC116215050 [Punica granatum]|uniref:FAD-dependent oxidoreductase domain-containing protein 1 n=1 Tax=Punica granatum TaxID=22663 RepID=A0A6P8E8Y9_PUNGR|nr:uncharacterized protein LOC116215050 [Punica granatum]